jgi:hypothetical protein
LCGIDDHYSAARSAGFFPIVRSMSGIPVLINKAHRVTAISSEISNREPGRRLDTPAAISDATEVFRNASRGL